MRDTFWFQRRVGKWVDKYLGTRSAQDAQERNLRFLEESTELVQARGMTRREAHDLIDYVYDRPKGNQEQEVGGVVVTLSALCNQAGILISEAAYKELERIEQPEVGEKVKARQKTKPSAVRSPTNGEDLPPLDITGPDDSGRVHGPELNILDGDEDELIAKHGPEPQQPIESA